MSDFNAWEYIRVVNLRGDPDYMANSDEKIISSNRTAGAILGNPHIVKTRSMQERERVITAFKETFQNDLDIEGPMWQICQNIANEIVEKKQKIALSCYCQPSACHLDHVVPVIVKIVQQKLQIIKNSQNNSVKKFKA